MRTRGALRRLDATAFLLGCALVATVARADELPLPGPAVEGAVVAKGDAASVPHGEPLWELGLGIAGVHFPDYRGSDQTRNHVLPLPFVAYRGRILRADRDGARAILLAGRQIEFDMSLSASVPSDSKDNDARRGMPDLAATVEIGPSMNLELWQSTDRRFKLDLRLPVRAAITLEKSPQAIGVTFSPNINLDIRNFDGNWNIGLLGGPFYQDRRYHEYFYGVAPEFATASRPAYSASGGFAGWRAVAAFSRRLGNAWLGGFMRYDDLNGAVFASSPLMRRERSFTAGFGISWIFAVSNQRVAIE